MTSSYMKRGLAGVVVTVASMGLWAGSALATETEVLNEVAKAAQIEGAAPATETLEVVKQGSQVLTQTGSFGLSVPAGKVTRTAEGSIVDGNGDSQIVFQKVGDQDYRASIHIASRNDPERYDFKVVGASELQHAIDGSVLVVDADGAKAVQIQAPWAKDAAGKNVPTHYEINGTTLTQVVDHQGGDFAYGITADPSVKLKWYGYDVKFSKGETAAIAAAGVGAAILAAKYAGPVAGTAITVAGLLISGSAAAARANDKCLKYQSGAPLVKPFKHVGC